jgi:hypothetical protein
MTWLLPWTAADAMLGVPNWLLLLWCMTAAGGELSQGSGITLARAQGCC